MRAATAMLANAAEAPEGLLYVLGGGIGALFPMVFTVGMQVLRQGRHELRLLVGPSELASLRFTVNVA